MSFTTPAVPHIESGQYASARGQRMGRTGKGEDERASGGDQKYDGDIEEERDVHLQAKVR